MAKRHALIIGNSAYATISPLANPRSDTQALAKKLRDLDFNVTLVLDSNLNQFQQAIKDFGQKLRKDKSNDAALFYYAGHAVQHQGQNYLMPTDVSVRDIVDLPITSIQAGWILNQMKSAGERTNIIILDACRDNPFSSNVRSAKRGLSRLSAPLGSFIAYSTSPNAVALDGRGRHSPYAAALLSNLDMPGIPIELLFKRVRIQVVRRTGGRQVPWDSSSLTTDFYFAGQKQTAPVGIVSPQTSVPPPQVDNPKNDSRLSEEIVRFLKFDRVSNGLWKGVNPPWSAKLKVQGTRASITISNSMHPSGDGVKISGSGSMKEDGLYSFSAVGPNHSRRWDWSDIWIRGDLEYLRFSGGPYDQPIYILLERSSNSE